MPTAEKRNTRPTAMFVTPSDIGSRETPTSSASSTGTSTMNATPVMTSATANNPSRTESVTSGATKNMAPLITMAPRKRSARRTMLAFEKALTRTAAAMSAPPMMESSSVE